jgi:glycosyltransferase involved in cell wall biosynthesis
MVFEHAESVIVQTEANKAILMKNCGVEEEKIKIIPNAVDTKLFNPTQFDQRQIREKYGVGKGRVILFAGRLTTQKGLEYLLKAISLIKECSSHVKLVVVGSGPQEDSLRDLALTLGIADNVSFLGNMSHGKMPEVYSLADVFVLPSLSESFPNAMLEAMAMEKPVVATRVGVIPEIIVDGKTAVTIRPARTEQLADAIARILSDDKFSRRIAQGGLKLVTEKFTWDYVVRRTVQVYEKALN